MGALLREGIIFFADMLIQNTKKMLITIFRKILLFQNKTVFWDQGFTTFPY